jgi:hypothetical protein
MFCGQFVEIWYIFSRFGILYQEKSGSPGFDCNAFGTVATAAQKTALAGSVATVAFSAKKVTASNDETGRNAPVAETKNEDIRQHMNAEIEEKNLRRRPVWLQMAFKMLQL